ncbi:MAG: DUF6151 family protein [Polyangiales bacterium]|nr:hypothetical protein [Myxococcales bacterium]
MKIRCDCGRFEAELRGFPRNSPGRLVCYCDDCQAFARAIGRDDVLDPYGGTEVVPVYPRETFFLKGRELLRCNRLTPRGLFRWTTTCCNTPIANTRPGLTWVGVFHNTYTVEDPNYLERLGPVRSRIMGRHAKGNPPFAVDDGIGVRGVLAVLPFMAKGMLLRMARPSPFFEADGVTPISPPVVLGVKEKEDAT